VQQPVQPARSHVHAPFVQACDGAQAAQLAPAVPQAAAVGGLMHWPFWSQQPFGQVVAEQIGVLPPVPDAPAVPPVDPAAPVPPVDPAAPAVVIEPPVPPALPPRLDPPAPAVVVEPPLPALDPPAPGVGLEPAAPASDPAVPPVPVAPPDWPTQASACPSASASNVRTAKRSEGECIGLSF